MPLYNTATAAAALGLPPKWLDNLLSHNKIDGVSSECQGVARRLSLGAVETIALVWEMSASLGLPVNRAIQIAHELMGSGGSSVTRSGLVQLGLVQLSVDLPALRRGTASRLAHAVEVAPSRRRGRPPRSPGQAMLP